MRYHWIVVLMMVLGGWTAPASASCPGALAFRPLADENPVDSCERYRGTGVLVVTTASPCMFTDHYKGLEAFYGRYGKRGSLPSRQGMTSCSMY